MSVLLILEHYKYLIIFPVVVLEGPITTVICGFLVYLGILDVFVAYPFLVFSDLIGDSLYYYVGKYGVRFEVIKKLINFFGYDKKKEEFLENHFKNHTIKTLLIAKVSHGLGIPVQIAAGMTKVKFSKYLLVELMGTLPKTLFLLVLGFYLGNSYQKINNYLHAWVSLLIVVLVLVLLYLLVNKYISKKTLIK